MVTEQQVEQVYDYIWDYLNLHQRLPLRQEIALDLNFTRNEVNRCIEYLHIDERLYPTTLLPTDYSGWWRENVRDERSTQFPKIARPQKRRAG